MSHRRTDVTSVNPSLDSTSTKVPIASSQGRLATQRAGVTPHAAFGVLILLLALGLRLHGITWQLPWRLHPDEPPHVEEAVTQAATLNFSPGYVNQPALFRNVLAIELIALDRAGLLGSPLEPVRELTDTEIVAPHPLLTRAYALGRITSAVFGAGTVLLVYLAVRPFLGTLSAALGALTLALSLAHVRETHFATTTGLAIFLSTLAMYFACRFALKGQLWRLAASCVAVALAILTRDLMLFAIAYPTVALLVRHFHPRDVRWWLSAVGVGIASIVTMLLGYVFLLPYHNQEQFKQGVVIFYKVSESGQLKWPELWVLGPYAATASQSLTFPLVILAVAGAFLMFLRETRTAILFSSCFFATLLALMIHARPWLRFGIPLEIFLSISAGFAIAQIARRATRRGTPAWAVAPLVCALFAFPLINAAYFGWLTGREDTRVTARNWIQTALPPRSLIYAPENTLPNVRSDQASGFPNTITAIWNDDIPTVITGQGCGEVLVLGSFHLDPASSIEQAGLNAAGLGPPLVQFSSGHGNRHLEGGPDDEFSPFWNLWSWARPGPTIELYEMTRPCGERGPQHPPVDLIMLTTGDRGTEAWSSPDPRLITEGPRLLFPTDDFPQPVLGAVIGSFVSGEPSNLQAVLFEQSGQQRLGLYRISTTSAPHLIMLDDEVITSCRCVSPAGIAAADIDGDGVDELLALREDQGIQSLDIFSLNAARPRLIHRAAVEGRSGRPAETMAIIPADITGPARIAFLFEIGSQYWIDSWEFAELSRSFSRSVRTATYVFPAGNRDLSTVISFADVDGDGRNELALLNDNRQSIEIFRLPALGTSELGRVTHYQRRPVVGEAQLIYTGTVRPKDPPREETAAFLQLDQQGPRLEVTSIAPGSSSPFLVQVTRPQELGRLGRRDVVGSASGHFLTAAGLPSLAIMYAEGRTVTVELYQRNFDGTLRTQGIELDRWRAESSDSPVGLSLAAIDLDGDGRDELVSGRKTSPRTEQYELHFHRLQLEPTPSAGYLGRVLDPTPAGTVLSAITRVRRSAQLGDQLAVAYRAGSRAYIDTLDVTPGPEVHLAHVQPWRRLDDEQIIGFAASFGSDELASHLYLALRDSAARQIEMAALAPDGTLGPIQEIPWPDLRNARSSVASME
ncbi:MAG: glycosyltransferase family 39 protein [Chloroflexota bacterium]